MDENEELLAGLKTTRNETTTTWKLAEEGADLLRKAKEEKEAFQAKTRRLAKEKVEEEVTCLRQELQDLQAGFAT